LTPKTSERYTIPGPAGALEVVLNLPPSPPRGIALVAHPHPLQGGTLDNKVAQTLAKTFFALGYASVRCNFRGVGRSAGSFDDGVGETDDALATLAYARHRFRGEHGPLPVVLAGFSFGCYVQSRVAAARRSARTAGTVRIEVFFYYSGHADEKGLLLGNVSPGRTWIVAENGTDPSLRTSILWDPTGTWMTSRSEPSGPCQRSPSMKTSDPEGWTRITSDPKPWASMLTAPPAGAR